MNKLLGTTMVGVWLAAMNASIAVAQTTANPSAASTSGHAPADRPFSRPTERVEARLAYVKAALKITPAQQSQWDAYADVVRKNAQATEQRTRRPGETRRRADERPNAIERLERAHSFHAEAVTRINELLAVQKPLYAALSREQQQIADVVLNRRMRPMRGAHGHAGFGRG